jgi:hypothetical protein
MTHGPTSTAGSLEIDLYMNNKGQSGVFSSKEVRGTADYCFKVRKGHEKWLGSRDSNPE